MKKIRIFYYAIILMLGMVMSGCSQEKTVQEETIASTETKVYEDTDSNTGIGSEITIIAGGDITTEKMPLTIELTPNKEGYGSVTVDWSTYDCVGKNFKVYKSKNGKDFQTVGIDCFAIEQIRVLNISANNYFESWMEGSEYGRGIIYVDVVSNSDYNLDPYSYLQDEQGNWRYDVIAFGFYDDYHLSEDLNDMAYGATEMFIQAGNGCILSHGVLGDCTPDGLTRNYYKLAEYAGVFTTPGDWSLNETVEIKERGLLTTYPWQLGEKGGKLTIPATHTCLETPLHDEVDIWLQFEGATDPSKTNYLTTYNNVAVIQAGHLDGQTTADEQKILANLVFYMNQLFDSRRNTKDRSAQDYAAPEIPQMELSGDEYKFYSCDLGTEYYYYVESYHSYNTTKLGLVDTSDIKSVCVETGVKGYYYLFDNDSNTVVTKEHILIEDGEVPVSAGNGNQYLHVAAVDNAGNLSATTTFELSN